MECRTPGSGPVQVVPARRNGGDGGPRSVAAIENGPGKSVSGADRVQLSGCVKLKGLNSVEYQELCDFTADVSTGVTSHV